MNKYETVIIINDTLTQEKKDLAISEISDYIAKNGNVLEIKKIGSKELAYEVRKQKTAYYCVINFKSEPSFINELERLYRIKEEILKFITIRLEE